MSVSTYGIAPPVRGPRVSGPSLLQIGSATRDAGMSTMAGAAGAEQQRTIANQELEQEGKAGWCAWDRRSAAWLASRRWAVGRNARVVARVNRWRDV
jgi:hypothetical protein